MGFSPGFAYLDGPPGPLRRVPRRDRPRPVVPAGSVALANGHAAVYPTASPGGWHLVGRTGFPLFSVDEPPYAALAPGDRVHFTVAGRGRPVDRRRSTAAVVAAAGPRQVLEVVAPGLRAVLQDGGRRGVAAVGVPAAGPADPVSFALANRLVGNPPGAGALELTGGGTRLRCLGAVSCRRRRCRARAARRRAPVPAGQVLPLAPGQLLEVGPLPARVPHLRRGRGRLLGPQAFGSTASDELCRLGAGPLGAGHVLMPGRGHHRSVTISWPARHRGRRRRGAGRAPRRARSHPEGFEPDALARLAGVVFRGRARQQPGGDPAARRGRRAACAARARPRRARFAGRGHRARCRSRPMATPSS